MIKKVKMTISEYFFNLAETAVNEDFPNAAAEMAFMMAIGIFPFMLFVMAVFGWLGKKTFVTKVMVALTAVAPSDVISLIKTVMNEVVLFKQGGIIATIGLIATIIIASNAVAVVIKGLNRASKVNENRSFIRVRLLAILMVLVQAVFLLVCINLIVFGKIIVGILFDYHLISSTTQHILMIGRWPVSFLMLFILATINYYVLPARDYSVVRKSVIPGAMFFCIFWLIGSWGFSLYINQLGAYNKVYGTIGAFAILMMWFYYTSLIILVGGEINNQTLDKLSENA